MVNKAYAVLTFSLDKKRLDMSLLEILNFLEKYDEVRLKNWYYKVEEYNWERDELIDFLGKIKQGDHRVGRKEAIFLLYLHTGKIYLLPIEGRVEDFGEAIRVKLFLNKQTYLIRVKQKHPELAFV